MKTIETTVKESRTRQAQGETVTINSETGRDELAVRRVLYGKTRQLLDEVSSHSLGRTGVIARAISAAFIALRDNSVLARGHRRVLDEFECMVSLDTGVGMRYVCWRNAVGALLRALRPDPVAPVLIECGERCEERFKALETALTPQKLEQFFNRFSEQLLCGLSPQQEDHFQQVLRAVLGEEKASREDLPEAKA